MPQEAALGPLQEGDLGLEAWLDPHRPRQLLRHHAAAAPGGAGLAGGDLAEGHACGGDGFQLGAQLSACTVKTG